jgi:UDP-N-acetylmuramoyl-L-alanyl-D-glutamate--2,6-diaminopimelate ligase
MKLEQLLKDIPEIHLIGRQDLAITGISSNSKRIIPGSLFIAKKGKRCDGASFVTEAVHSGAVALVVESYHPAFKDVAQLIHPNPAGIEGFLSAAFYSYPSDKLFLIGITGTNGKTTTSYLLKNLLDQIRGPCGLIGTVEYQTGLQRYPATLTTPDVIANQQMLSEMVDFGCRSAVMEVTSIGIDQGRVDAIDFDIALFTNLTQDHLDYHQTMEAYCSSKNQLFRSLGNHRQAKAGPKWAIVNQDSSWVSNIVEGCSAAILTYGIDTKADLTASDIHVRQGGTFAKVSYRGESLDFVWPMIGRFNVYNCLAAIAVLLTCGLPLNAIVPLMQGLSPVKGRLEPIQNTLGLNVYVDFAHTDDALRNVLQTIRQVHPEGRLIVVFGCGGDRDHDKRPKMARACEEYADLCILTSDNPRSEDPMKICCEAIQGFSKQGSYQVEVDRRRAIQSALGQAVSGDAILIAGRGHEKAQIFAHGSIDFDDSEVTAEICKQMMKKGNVCSV